MSSIRNTIMTSLGVYVSSLTIFNIIETYRDSKTFLEIYRNHKKNITDSNNIPTIYTFNKKHVQSYEFVNILSEWEAVKIGAKYNFWERLGDSIIWPYTGISNIIPYIVLKFNKESKK